MNLLEASLEARPVKEPYHHLMNLENRLMRLLGRKHYVPAGANDITKKLGLGQAQAAEVRRELRGLLRSGRVVRLPDKRFALPAEEDLIAGRILMNRRGGGRVVTTDASQPAIDISPNAAGTAMHNDRVLVLVDSTVSSVRPRGQRQSAGPRGKVVEVLERARMQVVGTLEKSRQLWYVVPSDPRITHDIYLPKLGQAARTKARRGDKVVVEITEWPSRHNAPEGKLVEVIGSPGAPGVDVESVIRQYELPNRFPAKVQAEARRLGGEVTATDRKGRRDCRKHLVVTIDPVDARDFDDAISLERLEGRRWRLWVHIADVSHYVTPGSTLDKEARRRGNSTYLVDRVIPMLPEALSNELCSLKPGADRLARSVEFVLTESGRVEQAKFHSTVICSKCRFTYEEAMAVLERKPAGDIEQMLHDAHHLAQKLRQARFRSGALNLDVPERKVLLDANGRVSEVRRVENDVSHQLIEEFMLLANETIAREIKRRRAGAIHRVHEEPDTEKLDNLRAQAALMGLRAGNLADQKQAGKFLASLNDHPLADVFRVGYLRCMKRACYSTEPIGHYGLAKEDYVHFTSPIRRYADLIVHRVVYQKARLDATALATAADHISLTERNSADAELDSKLIKLLSHLQRQLDRRKPETYTAMVTEVRSIGAMVDITELGLKGLVKRLSLSDDHYRFVPERGRLVGRLRGNEIVPGDQLKVQVEGIDLQKKQADFRVIKTKSAKGKKKNSKPLRKPQRAAKPDKFPKRKDTRKQPKSKRRRK
jgi:ribonuclease R|tara:strand:- start:1775 stop:4075 length:2301 start_codon:yes stop_codon:yes gene_type:complete